jgi:hypothetical protein
MKPVQLFIFIFFLLFSSAYAQKGPKKPANHSFQEYAGADRDSLSSLHRKNHWLMPDLKSEYYQALVAPGSFFLRKLNDLSEYENYTTENASQFYRFLPADANGYGIVFISEACRDIDFFQKYMKEGGTLIDCQKIAAETDGFYKPYRYIDSTDILIFSGDPSARLDLISYTDGSEHSVSIHYRNLDLMEFRLSKDNCHNYQLLKYGTKYAFSYDWIGSNEFSLSYHRCETLGQDSFLTDYQKKKPHLRSCRYNTGHACAGRPEHGNLPL